VIEDHLLVKFGEIGGHGGKGIMVIAQRRLATATLVMGWRELALTTKGTKHTKLDPQTGSRKHGEAEWGSKPLYSHAEGPGLRLSVFPRSMPGLSVLRTLRG
jgi:hypothetical protein